MRVTQGMEQAQFLTALNQLESSISNTQNDISTGLSFTTASQNPVAAGLVSGYNQVLAQSQQYTANGNSAQSSLNTEDSALTQVQNALQSLRDLALEANNATHIGARSQRDRHAGPADPRHPALPRQHAGRQRQLHFRRLRDADAAVCAERDRRHVQRRSGPAAGANRSGTNGRRRRQRRSGVQPNQDRERHLQRDRRGRQHGHRSHRRHHGHRSGRLRRGLLFDRLYGAEYLSGPNTANHAVVASGTYTAGQAIAFAGVQVTLSGQPAAGDSFNVAPSTNQSIFTTVQNLVTALQQNTATPQGRRS